jgi:uncharacterized protein (DUF3084 family)
MVRQVEDILPALRLRRNRARPRPGTLVAAVVQNRINPIIQGKPAGGTHVISVACARKCLAIVGRG